MIKQSYSNIVRTKIKYLPSYQPVCVQRWPTIFFLFLLIYSFLNCCWISSVVFEDFNYFIEYCYDVSAQTQTFILAKRLTLLGSFKYHQMSQHFIYLQALQYFTDFCMNQMDFDFNLIEELYYSATTSKFVDFVSFHSYFYSFTAPSTSLNLN